MLSGFDNACMTRRLDQLLLRFLLHRVLERACPDTVHRSGDEGMRVNCFNTVIPEGAKPRTVLLSISGSTVQGLEFDGHRHQNLVTMDLADIDGAKLEVTLYYGLDTVRYEGVFRLAIGSVTKWPYLLIHALRLKNLLLQRWFNAREMKLGDRLTVLQDVANLTNEGVQKIGAQEVMSHRYGYRWAAHPGWLAFQQRLDRQLECVPPARLLVFR